MSLINDALKRAKENQPATTPAPEPDKPMQPVEPPADASRGRGLPPYFIPAVLIVLCGACWFLLQGWESKRQAGIYPDPITINAREPEPSSEPTAGTVREPTPEELKEFGVDPAALSGVSAKPAAVPTATAPTNVTDSASARPQPAFKLQGIFYRANNPSAMINSRTVYVGETIDDAKVKSIDRQSVTLLQDGQTRVLTLY